MVHSEVEMQRVSSFEELYEIMSNLHDCPFDLDEATFDEAAGRWSGTFFRPLWEHPGAERRWFFLVYCRSRLPVAQASICVTGVTDVQVIDDQGIGRYTLNEIERTGEGVQLRFNEVLRIDLHLAAGIEGTYDEQPLPGVRAVYRTFLIVQSGPKIEELADRPSSQAPGLGRDD